MLNVFYFFFFKAECILIHPEGFKKRLYAREIWFSVSVELLENARADVQEVCDGSSIQHRM